MGQLDPRATPDEPSAPIGAYRDPAGFGRRLSASLIDGILLTLVLHIGVDLLTGTDIGIIALIAVAGLYSLVEGFTGCMPGKLILGLRIRNGDGTKATRSKLLGRWALKNIGYVCGTLTVVTKTSGLWFLGLLGALTVVLGGLLALGPNCQTLHDKLAHTAVFRVSSSSRFRR